MKSITVRNYRCFGDTEQIAQLAPLTLLVGENSSGKTSLMALIRALWDPTDRPGRPGQQRQRPAGRIIDAEDLHIAQTDDQLADTRRVLLHRGPPRNWCVSTPILEAPNPTIADPVPAHFRRAPFLVPWAG